MNRMNDTVMPTTRIWKVLNAKWIEELAEDTPEDQLPEMKTARKVEGSGSKGDPQTVSRGQAVHRSPSIQRNGQLQRWEW
jgi:hypothetical protein